MLLTDIKNLTNSRLAGEQLTYSALLPYLDAVVDEINETLHAKFKTFTEVNPTGISGAGFSTQYAEFPDKYIRTVVCIGAAYKWYIDDEEGIETAGSLGMQYKNNLFIMQRDYGPLVPEDKQQNNNSGFLRSAEETESINGINPDYKYIEVPGLQGTSVYGLNIVNKNGVQHLQAKLINPNGSMKTVDCGAIDVETFTIAVNRKLAVNPLAATYNVIGFEVEDD